MKKQITQFALVVVAFIGLTFLMAYTKPAADEPKQYIVVKAPGASSDKFEAAVNEKLAAGWHLQGGVSTYGTVPIYIQAMVK